jgi:hypothetical protein
MNRGSALVLALALAGAGSHGAVADETNAESFVYASAQGVTYVVTADGLASIRIGDREVAGGGWRLANPGEQFRSVSNGVAVGAVAAKTWQRLSERHVRVSHVQGDAAATYDYTFDGEDVSVRARVENRHPAEDLPAVAFRGLTFRFDAPPTGIILDHGAGYIEPNGGLVAFCYPCWFSRVGASYARDKTFGVAFIPTNPGLTRHLLLWNEAYVPPGREPPRERSPQYLVPDAVPHGGARTFLLAMRVSTNTDWTHLLAPYRRFFQANYGPVRYRADHRPFANSGGGCDYHADPGNPYGFNGLFRRYDRPDGMQLFCDEVIPALKAADCQGVMFWALQGWEPRGAMYRTDFDVFPRDIARNLPLLRREFHEAGLRLGLCTRPGESTFRYNAASDATQRINADDPWHLQMTWRRFQWAIENGFTAFYLDTFGNTLADVKIMRYLREKMGPDIQTYVEHHCDIMAVYSGFYEEIGVDRRNRRFYNGDAMWPYYSWLVPGIPTITQIRAQDSDLPEVGLSPRRYAFQIGISPMPHEYLVGSYAKELRALCTEFLDPNGQWKQPENAWRR